MKVLLTRLAVFAGRHWLRVGLIGCALVLLSQKQVNFNVRLGHPAHEPLPATDPLLPDGTVADGEPLLLSDGDGGVAAGQSLFSRLNIFGSSKETAPSERIAQRPTAVAGFLTRFGHVAQAEQQKYGIPASVILGVGLLYSQSGTATVANRSNNYFALLCTSDWRGESTTAADGRCLRVYTTAWTGFRDFSTTVTQGDFAKMRQFGPRDYRRWAAGLQELGLNNDPRLAQDLIAVIERYSLTRYD